MVEETVEAKHGSRARGAASEGHARAWRGSGGAGYAGADMGNYRLTADGPRAGHAQEQAAGCLMSSMRSEPPTPKAMVLSPGESLISLVICGQTDGTATVAV